jgi:hypothetical protein
MTNHSKTASAGGRPAGLAPETRNSEQDERGEQAQDVAADAMVEESAKAGATESSKAPSPGVDNIGGNESDLIDEMCQMEDSGKIDNSAFAGEPDHDDEPGRYRDSGQSESETDTELDALRVTTRP